jgi:hypothetical protein
MDIPATQGEKLPQVAVRERLGRILFFDASWRISEQLNYVPSHCRRKRSF